MVSTGGQGGGHYGDVRGGVLVDSTQHPPSFKLQHTVTVNASLIIVIWKKNEDTGLIVKKIIKSSCRFDPKYYGSLTLPEGRSYYYCY